MRTLFQKFTQGLLGAPEPKVIWLRGEPLRRGLDTREASHKIQEVMQTLVPDPFRLELGEEYWPLGDQEENVRSWLENHLGKLARVPSAG